MRSAMMLRWIWLVPAAIVNEVERSRSSTKAPDGQRADVVARQAGPVEHPHGQVGDALEQLGVVRPSPPSRPGPGTPCALGLREVALGHGPQRVHLGLEVADLAAQRDVVPRGGRLAG